jgi:hypothetical protein
MWINHHPAPGFGDLIPGFFVVPQNPIVDNKSRALMPYGFAGDIGYVPKFGDLMPSRLAVPSNPLIRALRAGMSGCCCGGDGGSGDTSGQGTNGAAASDTATGYVNGAPVLGAGVGEFVQGLDLQTLVIGGALGAIVLGLWKR